jgi:hypothetical protein
MAAFKFYLQSGKYRKVDWVGEDSHVVFGQIFLGEKGDARWHVDVMQRPLIKILLGGSNVNKILVTEIG